MKTEINLLSPDAKRERITHVRARRVMSITVATVFALALVASSYGVAFWALSVIHASVSADMIVSGQKTQEIMQGIRANTAIITAVDNRLRQESPSAGLVSDIIGAIPPAISILTLEFTEKSQAFVLTGKTTQGSSVVQYQRALEKLSWVDRVIAPLQNFAVSPEATVTFTIIRKTKEGGAL